PGGLLDVDGAAAAVAAWQTDLAWSPAMLRVKHRRAPIRVGLEHDWQRGFGSRWRGLTLLYQRRTAGALQQPVVLSPIEHQQCAARAQGGRDGQHSGIPERP